MSFYEEINTKINDYIRSLTNDDEQINEVTQESLIKIHKSIDNLKDEEKLSSWIKRIVYTSLMDFHRKKQQTIHPEHIEKVTDVIETEEENENEKLSDCIKLLLKNLPEDQRELLEKVELEGMSQVQYANEHNLPISTVKSRVQRAKKKLKEQIMSDCFIKTDSYGNVVDYHYFKNNSN